MSTTHQSHHDGAESNSGDIDCPKCSSRMSIVNSGDVEIDRCMKCGGLWFDALELDKLLQQRGAMKRIDVAGGSVAPDAKARLCPRDKARLIDMRHLDQPHVKYESCKICGGLFLDAGELNDLSVLTLAERVRRALKL